MTVTSITNRLRKLEEKGNPDRLPSVIFLSGRDPKLAGLTVDEALARRGIEPGPKDRVVAMSQRCADPKAEDEFRF